MWGRGLLVIACALAGIGALRAQSLPPPLPDPTNKFGTPSTDYFGPSFNSTFDPKTMFPPAQSVNPGSLPPPEIPSVLPADTSGPDGGLLPPKPAPRIWHGTAEAGTNGASGNTDIFNARGGWNVRRKTERNLFTTDFVYMYSQQDGEVTQQAALFNARDEILFPGSRWSVFAANQIEYDELRAYTFRVGEYIGAGYKVRDDKQGLLRFRIGAGATRELGYANDNAPDMWVPEGVLGYDLRYRFDPKNAIVSIVDYYPRLDQWGQFRLRARVAYEWVIDPNTGTVIRLGVQERYDSNPGDALRNDLTYFATFGINF